jgi:hypothetical protein
VSDDQPDATAPEFSVVAGSPGPAELAAVTAVLGALLEQLGDERAQVGRSAPNAWERSQRPIRGTLATGPGAWRGFSA